MQSFLESQMANFRCNSNGTIISFTNEDDIAGLRKHEGYTEVLDEKANETKTTIQEPAPEEKRQVLIRRGRPPKGN